MTVAGKVKFGTKKRRRLMPTPQNLIMKTKNYSLLLELLVFVLELIDSTSSIH